MEGVGIKHRGVQWVKIRK